MKGNLRKILPVIFSILIFSSIFISQILKNTDSESKNIQLSPRSVLYKEKYGEGQDVLPVDLSSDGFITNTRVNMMSGVSEPKIICNPIDKSRLVISSNDFLIQEGYARIFTSSDTGKTWTPVMLNLSGAFRQSSYSDPWMDYDEKGNLYFVAVQMDLINSGKEGLYFSKSTDNGLTWQTDFNFVDYNSKENIKIDRPKIYCSKQHEDKTGVYVTWIEFKGIHSYVMLSKSADGGKTFSQPEVIQNKNVEFYSFSGNGRGELYLVYLNDEHELKVRLSVDEAKTWTKEFGDFRIKSAGEGNDNEYELKKSSHEGIRVGSEPSVFYSAKNLLYITYSAPGHGKDEADVYFVRLDLATGSITEPKRVNVDNTTNDQFLPSITSDASDNIYIMYQDSRNDADNVITESYISVSIDGGLSFTDHKLSTRGYDPTTLAVDSYIGDYNSCTVSGDQLIGVWTDGRNNNFDLYVGMFQIQDMIKYSFQ